MKKALSLAVILLEAAAALAACWLFLPDHYHTAVYRVDIIPRPFPVNYASLAVVVLVLAIAACRALALSSNVPLILAKAWSPLLVSLLIILRAAFKLAPFFLEPLLLALSIAAAAYFSFSLAQAKLAPPAPAKPGGLLAPLLVLAIAALAAAWFYLVQADALSKLVLGYADAGIYYLRVKNTGLGRGLLQTFSFQPPFYDHFDLGLLVLVPAYVVFKTFKMFMWSQAVFLAAMVPALYVYAKGRGLRQWPAFAVALLVLLQPSVSQLSLSFSYGFHPVTLAMPAIILSIHFWEKRRWLAFALAAAFAMSMEETIIPFYAGMGLVELLWPGNRRAGLVLAAASVVLFVVVTKLIMPGYAESQQYYQFAKFSHLGSTFREIIASPFARPAVFWGLIFSRQSLIFVAVILGSMGFLPLLAPRQFLYPAIVLVFVLLLSNPDVKSISFQYQTCIIAGWLPAMVAGIDTLSRWHAAGAGSRPRLAAAVAAVLAAALVTSHFYGMLPWSRVTIPFQVRRSEAFMRDAAEITDLAKTAGRDSNVLATMRAATLFVDASGLKPLPDWRGEMDYDFVVLQTDDTWGQTAEQITAALDRFAAAPEFRSRRIGRFVVFERLGPRVGPSHIL
jgi:uncharacterized membrane protein